MNVAEMQAVVGRATAARRWMQGADVPAAIFWWMRDVEDLVALLIGELEVLAARTEHLEDKAS